MKPLSFQKLSFRTKLTVVVTTVTALALVLVAAAVVASQHTQMRRSIHEEVSVIAEIIAKNSEASLAFDDHEAAQAVLESLAAQPDIRAAAIYTSDGRLFVSYPAGDDDAGRPPVPEYGATTRWEDGRMLLFHPITMGGDVIGSVYLSRDLADLRQHLVRQTLTVLAAVTVALLTSMLLTLRLQRQLVRPVRHLAETTRRVSRDRDYSVRAERLSGDEVGELTDSFNEMLAEIQRRAAELQAHRDELERRVQARTADLELARAELEQRNDALREAEARAVLANTAKSAFLANMSHEIRSPMTAILGYAEILYHEGDLIKAPPQRLDAIDTIRRNGRHLLNIINDILDLSKLEAGKMSVERVHCSPAQIALDVVELMRVRAGIKGLRLEAEAAGPIPATIQSDPTRLRQILVNLIGNAIKFTATGAVRLVMRLDRDAPEGPLMAFDVIDTGIGLNEQQLRRLFQPFTQADASTTRRYGGTGLGLTISKRFAELLGGDIDVESTPGAGCRFTVNVATGPLDGVPMVEPGEIAQATVRAAEPAGSQRRQSALRNASILLAEDTPDNQRLIRYHLEKTGAAVRVAANGREAVQAALAAEAAGRPFDVILMDMQMPELDGYEATRQLRDAGYRHPIVALTAHAMRGDRERCLAAGMDGYIAKPIQPEAMFAAVRDAMDHAGAEIAAAGEPMEAASLDADELQQRFADAPDLLVELIEIFAGEHARRMQELHRAADEGDLEQLRRLAHALRGSVSNFAAIAATEAARRLEAAAAEGDRDAAQAALAALERELAPLLEKLEALKRTAAARA